jgi:putative iron-regulated protein
MKKIYVLALAGAMLAQFSCKHKTSDPAPTDYKQQVVENYANIVYATYDDSWMAANTLKVSAQSFVDAPSADGLEAVKAAYKSARTSYIQSEAFRFASGPIDDSRGLEGLLNSWPLDESFIDYSRASLSDPIINGGIINSPADFPVIDKDMLINNNAVSGDENISCGYHAVEFLLWGQDFYAYGPGERPYTDYLLTADSTALNPKRRGQYLLACIDLIIDNLATLKLDWKTGAQNYRASFVADPNGSIGNFLTGSYRYANGELSVERMQVALDNADPGMGDGLGQEHEQSCFSDQTHNDIILGQRGISNVYTGRYVRTDGSVVQGYGLDDLVQSVSDTINSTTIIKVNQATAAAAAIPPPFDQAILNTEGRILVQAAINALHAEAAQFVVAGASLGLIIN